MFDSNCESVIDMIFYLTAVAVITISLLIFYFNTKKTKTNIPQIQYGLLLKEKQAYTDSANRCKKDNSPISGEPFHKLFLDGSDIINNESFSISNSIESGGNEYNVLWGKIKKI